MKQVFPMDSRVTYDAEGRPSYDRAVSSKPLRSLIRKLFTTGVMPNPSDTCQVRAGGDGMTLIVSPGLAVLEGGLYLEDAARTLSVTAADPTFDRIDTVVLRWNENDAVRDCDLHIVAGVPAKNPVRPALTREGSIYEIGLADIFVTKGVATITNEKITDTRMESARCGIVSSVSEFDTTTIYQQIQSDLAGFKSNEQAEFMTWFDKMKDQLTTDAAGKLQTEVDDVRGQIHTNLLNHTAQTQTKNGVTFTNNGDGTYTVNGTASENATFFAAERNIPTEIKGKRLRVLGCPSGGSQSTYRTILYIKNGDTILSQTNDIGNGIELNVPQEATDFVYIIQITDGVTVSNLLFKPMLTTDLNAKYDDFVPYTGDSGRLNEDVANLFDVIRPVGSLYPTTDANFNPNTAKGWHGTWERIKDCVIYASGDSDTIGQIVGSNTHTLTEAELPRHTHSIPALSGSTNNAGEHIHNLYDYSNNLRYGHPSTVASGTNAWSIVANTGASNTIVAQGAGKHTHTITTNASTTGASGSGTAMDMRPRRLNSVVWRRTA